MRLENKFKALGAIVQPITSVIENDIVDMRDRIVDTAIRRAAQTESQLGVISRFDLHDEAIRGNFVRPEEFFEVAVICAIGLELGLD